LKENICAFPDHLGNLMRGITSVFSATSLSYSEVMWSGCLQNEMSFEE